MKVFIGMLAVVMVMLAGSGCVYKHRVMNTGPQMLYGVNVESRNYAFGHGYLPPKAFKGYMGSMRIVNNPAPVVSWKLSEEGDVITREVLLGRNPGRQEVVFEIDGETVRGFIGSNK